MARPRSLLRTVGVDRAAKAHDCQHDEDHRLQKGDLRLKVKRPGASPDHYCVPCALDFIRRDIQRLESLRQELTSDLRAENGTVA